MVYRDNMIIWVGRKLRFIVQLLRQVMENTELARGWGVQNAYIFMPERNVCALE